MFRDKAKDGTIRITGGVAGTIPGDPGDEPFVYSPLDYSPVAGLADNSTAIQAALAAAEAAGGGIVQMPKARQFGWSGAITVPPSVELRGTGKAALGLLALDATSKIQGGEWAGSASYIGGIRDLNIEGNGTGDPDGLVQFQSVFAQVQNCAITGAAGHGLVLDAAQNANVVGCRIFDNGDGGLVLKNGAGGYNFLGTHAIDNQRDLVIFDGDSSANNAYPFGSAHINFFGGIFESYVNSDYVGDIQCGGAITFWGTGFSNNGAVTKTGAAVVRINNAGFPVIGTYITFNSCTFNGGDANYPGVIIEGNQTVTFAGTNYIQQHDPGFCVVASGSPNIRNYGTFDHGDDVTAEFATTGAGSLVSLYSPQHANMNFVLPASRSTMISSRLDTDAGHRYFQDVKGKQNWNSGDDFGIEASFEYDTTYQHHLLVSGLYLTRRFGLYPATPIFANGAVALDTRASSWYQIVLTGSGHADPISFTNAVAGGICFVSVYADAGQSLTWDSNILWPGGGVGPEAPAVGKMLEVLAHYDNILSKWTARIFTDDPAIDPYLQSTGPNITVDDTAPSSPAINDLWVDTT
jgi:hypothetical protein